MQGFARLAGAAVATVAFACMVPAAVAAPPAADVRGIWDCTETAGGNCTWTIANEDPATGSFSGFGEGNGQTWPVSGSLDGTHVQFVHGPYDPAASTFHFDGTVAPGGGELSGTFDGGGGTFDYLRLATPGLIGFAPATSISLPGGTEPLAIAVGDFNDDGKADLALSSNVSDLTILLGNGSGGFSQASGSPHALGGSPQGIAVGHFNIDSEQDLAVANGNGTVSILVGDGTGGFVNAAGSPISTGATSTPVAVAVGLFNADANEDLAVADSGAPTVKTLTGNGGAIFNAPVDHPVAAAATDVAVADFDGDGNQDIAAGRTGGVSVLSGDGTGAFPTEADYGAGGATVKKIATGLLDGDTKPDLVVANGADDTASFLHNAGTSFDGAVDYPARTHADDVAVADFDGDGHPDFVAGGHDFGQLWVHQGTGGGVFSGPRVLSGTGGAYAVAAADFTSDGKPDLVTADGGADKLSLFRNTSTPRGTLFAAAGGGGGAAGTAASPPPPPTANRNVDAAPVSGTVTVQCPGGPVEPLATARQVALGCTIDATDGHVLITSAADAKGHTQTAEFWDGAFKIGQTTGNVPAKLTATKKKKHRKPKTVRALITVLTLIGPDPSGCKKKKGKLVAASLRRRRLWGHGRGRFRTVAHHASATVRGTKWLTWDQCNGTYVSVAEGVVAVQDFTRKRTVNVKAGHHYLAPAKKPRRKH